MIRFMDASHCIGKTNMLFFQCMDASHVLAAAKIMGSVIKLHAISFSLGAHHPFSGSISVF